MAIGLRWGHISQFAPSHHLGGRKQRTAEHSIHYLVERIYDGWNRRKIASLFLLDVTGAFDKVSHERLLHDLKRVGMDENIVNWIASFLEDRTTVLKTPEYTTDEIYIDVGIPQGSSLSPILYLFYNATILTKAAERENLGVTATGFIDDIGLLVIGNSTRENCEALQKIYNEICTPWTRTHGSEFAPAKYQLLHLSRKKNYSQDHPVAISEGIHPRMNGYITYLGVRLDSQLRWGSQAELARSKGAKSVEAMKRLSGSVWGASYHSIRKIYRAVTVPQITYTCSVWARSSVTSGDEPIISKNFQTV